MREKFSKIKTLCFSLTAFVIVFVIVEGVFHIISPPGAYSYIERRIFEQHLTSRKEKDEFRIFLFGESTMHGCYLYPNSTINVWMDEYFKGVLGKDQANHIKTYNFGRLGEESTFISNAFFQTLAYKPDLVIFYSAHNDFGALDNRNKVLIEKTIIQRAEDFFKDLSRKSRLLSFIKRIQVIHKTRRNAKKEALTRNSDPEYQEQVSKRYDEAKDYLLFKSPDFYKIFDHWKSNIRKIIDVASREHIPVIFFKGVANYRDFYPKESIHSPGLSQSDKKEWQNHYEKGRAFFDEGKFREAVTEFQAASAIDPVYARVYYDTGRAYEKLGEFEKANKWYKKSVDYDIMTTRGPSVVNQFYTELQKEAPDHVYVISTQELFEWNSKHGIVDTTLISDAIHPTVFGQSLMAKRVLDVIYENDLLPGRYVWNWERLPSYRQVYSQLNLDDDFWFKYHFHKAFYFGTYYNEKIEHAQMALAIRPDSINAKRLLAWTYWESGDKKNALPLYREIIAVKPRFKEDIKKVIPDLDRIF